MHTAGCSLASGSSNEPGLHLAAAQHRFRDRAFPCCRFHQANLDIFAWCGCRPTQAMLPVPTPCAGKSPETETIAAGARRCAVLSRPPVPPVSGSVPAASMPVPGRNWCPPQTGAVPASTRRPRRSTARGTGWPRRGCNWCGRSPWRATFPVGTYLAIRPPDRTVRALFRHTAPTLGA